MILVKSSLMNATSQYIMFLPLFIVLPGFERTQRSFVTTLLISRFVAINKPKEMQFLIQIKEKVVLSNCLFYLDLKQIIVITKTLKNREGFLLKGQRYLTSLLGFLWRVSSKLYPRRHVIQLMYLPLSHIPPVLRLFKGLSFPFNDVNASIV